MLNFNKTIRSERCFLRPMQVTEFDPMQVLTTDTNMWYYFTADLSNQNTLQAWINSAVADLNQQLALPLTILEPNKPKLLVPRVLVICRRLIKEWKLVGLGLLNPIKALASMHM